MRLSISATLKAGSMANFVRLGLNLSSTLKAQAWLGLNFWGLFPPLMDGFEKKLITMHANGTWQLLTC